MSDQGRQVAKVAALLAGGAVIGAGIGLLIAPQAGADTRRGVGRWRPVDRAWPRHDHAGRILRRQVRHERDFRGSAGFRPTHPSL